MKIKEYLEQDAEMIIDNLPYISFAISTGRNANKEACLILSFVSSTKEEQVEAQNIPVHELEGKWANKEIEGQVILPMKLLNSPQIRKAIQRVKENEL